MSLIFSYCQVYEPLLALIKLFEVEKKLQMINRPGINQQELETFSMNEVISQPYLSNQKVKCFSKSKKKLMT